MTFSCISRACRPHPQIPPRQILEHISNPRPGSQSLSPLQAAAASSGTLLRPPLPAHSQHCRLKVRSCCRVQALPMYLLLCKIKAKDPTRPAPSLPPADLACRPAFSGFLECLRAFALATLLSLSSCPSSASAQVSPASSLLWPGMCPPHLS